MTTINKDKVPIFLKQHRIPALFYIKQKKTLMAFAERRTCSNDTSAKALVMATGEVNIKDHVNIQVII